MPFIFFIAAFMLSIAWYPLAGWTCNYAWETFIAGTSVEAPGMWLFVGLLLISSFWRRMGKVDKDYDNDDAAWDYLVFVVRWYMVVFVVQIHIWVLSHFV